MSGGGSGSGSCDVRGCLSNTIEMCADKCRMEKAGILFERFSDDDNGDHDLRTVRLGLPISLEHLILFVHLYIFDLLIATRIEFFE